MVLAFLCKIGSIIVGTLFPCFNTYKATKKRDGMMQKFYNKYWTVFACFSSAEVIADLLYVTYLIPGYQMIKFGFLFWASWGGAPYVYDTVIFPFLKRHERQIDGFVSSTGQLFVKALGNLFSQALTSAITSVAKIPEALPSVSASFIGTPTAQSVSQPYSRLPGPPYRRSFRSTSVEEAFERPAASISTRIVQIEEMDDESWPSADDLPAGRLTVKQELAAPKQPRRSKRQAQMHALQKTMPVESQESGEESGFSTSNLGNTSYLLGQTTDDDAEVKFVGNRRNTRARRGRGRGRRAGNINNDASC